MISGYSNSLYEIDEMNPYGLKNYKEQVNYAKNTTLPEQTITVVQYPYTIKSVIESGSVNTDVRYEVKENTPHMAFKIYSWSVSGGTIISGGKVTDKYVVIRTTGFQTADINISLNVTDQKLNANFSGSFQHVVNFTDIPINILSIVEDVSGSCEFEPAGTCQTQSTYSATYENNSGTVLYSWNVTGASFVDNLDGTCTVTSDAGTDTVFTVELTLTDDYSVDVHSQEFTHTRTIVPFTFDQALLYDNTNIATEFIA